MSRFISRLSFLILLTCLLSACSTRGKVDIYDGSTAQRLVTYSINNLMTQLQEEDLSPFAAKPVYLRSHFINPSPVVDYANARLKLELESRFAMKLVDNIDDAGYILDFFFTSLGTDKDTFGLTVPIFWVSTDGQQQNLDILAVNMYHGVSELYYYSKDMESGKIIQHSRVLNRARADVFSTPIISFPVDDLEEGSFIDE
ncbi:MAG: hypothetical protein H7A01_01455 [Hahellaceae bacterium]|nr:hypothetical protein [Hahellaceae bacterium]MCP5212689.1 hypothetical protein [Hahellaceae bacterium]